MGGRPGEEAPGCMGGPTWLALGSTLCPLGAPVSHLVVTEPEGAGRGRGKEEAQSSPQVLPDQTGRDMVSDRRSTRAG